MGALIALLVGGATLPAVADPTAPATPPSQEQVDAAQDAVADKARTIEDVEAEYAAANARLASAELAAGQAAEAYNGARWHLEQAQAEATQAEAASVAATQRLAGHKVAFTELIANTYEQQPELHALNALTTVDGAQSVIDAASTTYQVSTAMDDIQGGYQRAETAAKKASARAAAARAEAADLAARAESAARQAQASAANAAAQADSVAQQKQALVAELAQLQNISVELAGQRQAAIEDAQRQAAAAAAEKAAQAASAKAAQDAAAKPAAQAPATQAAAPKPVSKPSSQPAPEPEPEVEEDTPSVPSDPAPVIDPTPPPASGGASAAIAFAKAQLGEPYLWAAAGPDRWDCSGLTMMAWREGGKYLPHYSVAQYDQSTPISMSSLAPGDLLFWSSNGRASGIHHVALYMGGGQYIHAPRAGKNVEIKSMSYWYPTMAARP